MKTMRQRWIDSFQDSPVDLWLLEEESDIRMYETKEHNMTMDGRQPVFHIWKGDDEWICASQNYMETYNKYLSLIQK